MINPTDTRTQDEKKGRPRVCRTGTSGLDIIVGRGTVRLHALGTPGVLLFADQLRRGKVSIVGSGYTMGAALSATTWFGARTCFEHEPHDHPTFVTDVLTDG